MLYQTAREFIGDALDDEASQTVFDLYSGTGTIAQILSPVAKKVIGVEIVEEAVVAARENAALNGLTNCEFIAGDVLKVIDTIGENRIISYLIRQEMESIRKHWRKSSAIMCRRWSIFPVNRPA